VTQAPREIGLMEDRAHERNNKMSCRKGMGKKNSGISFEMKQKRKKKSIAGNEASSSIYGINENQSKKFHHKNLEVSPELRIDIKRQLKRGSHPD
jgi:hypothetical protein